MRQARVSEAKLLEVFNAMKSERGIREYKRLQALYHYLSGKTRNEVSEISNLTPITITRIYNRYKSDGISGIYDKTIPGRPPFLSTEQQNEISSIIINTVPASEGFPSMYNWTADLVSKLIKKKYGIEYSNSGVTNMMHKMGLSFTQPTYVLAKADQQKQEEFKEEFKLVKKI